MRPLCRPAVYSFLFLMSHVLYFSGFSDSDSIFGLCRSGETQTLELANLLKPSSLSISPSAF